MSDRRRTLPLRTRAAARAGQAWRAARMLRLYRTWLRAYRNRLARGPRPGTVVYELRSGVRLAVEGGQPDVRVLNEIWLDRVYEPTPAFRIRDGWTILDLGAHKGGFAIYAAVAAPRTTVHAVEPSPVNLGALRRNVEANGLANVHVHECAVAAERGTGVLQFAASASHRGTLVLERGYEHRERVRVATLADLVADAGGRADLVKMDVEGAELSVLRAADADTLARVDRIVLEVHPVDGLAADRVGEELCALLDAGGFRCTHDRGRRLVHATRVEER